ncbi:sulfurtransferase TusA family protein [Aestuariirhabdus sp. LZHN29]|uniref:sulfurtransferase TusA family protein n=1 Tax=Aestuariirhabdus sp. LZHN29 TaxID=3417462 RepID=UPI003CFB32DF
MSVAIDVELDAKGLCCPLPLLKAKQALNTMSADQVLRVEATDAGSVRDFQAFCEVAGHRLLSTNEQEGIYVHVVQKGNS